MQTFLTVLPASPSLTTSVSLVLIPQMADVICAARLTDICDEAKVNQFLAAAGFGLHCIQPLSFPARVEAWHRWKSPARFLPAAPRAQ